MFREIVAFSVLLVAAQATGELSILASPKSLEFRGHEKLDSESLSDVLAASLGYSVENPSEWSGLFVANPFDLPRGVIAVVVDGVESVHIPETKTHSFSLVGSSTANELDTLTARVQEQKSLAVDTDLSEGYDELNAIFGEIKPFILKKTSSLKPNSNAVDKVFLEQLSVINGATEKFSSVTNRPVALILRISLASLVEEHGLASPAVTDAVKLLGASIAKLSHAAQQSYDDELLVVTVTTKDGDVRVRRAAANGESKQEGEANSINLAPTYSADYPVIFNIILWFGVIMTFTLLAISYAIAGMDPGRDSIIYRMTSTRMKKDN